MCKHSENNGLTVVKHSGIPQQEPLKRTFDLCVRKTPGNTQRLADGPKYGHH